MRIYDDVLDDPDPIESLLLSQDFPWHFIQQSSGGSQKVEGFTDTVQFEHHFVRNGEVISTGLDPLLKMIDWDEVSKKTKVSSSIFRIKSNLLLQTQSTSNTPHIDYPIPHTVLLYYVNDSDGVTSFYDKNFNIVDTVQPKKGRMVVFDGLTYHSSTPPQSSTHRCVINFNIENPD